MDNYGQFQAPISALEQYLAEVMSEWSDKTALSYHCINENMQMLTHSMWQYACDCENGLDAVERHYNQERFQSMVDQIRYKVMSV